jgi:hypothetical protein
LSPIDRFTSMSLIMIISHASNGLAANIGHVTNAGATEFCA